MASDIFKFCGHLVPWSLTVPKQRTYAHLAWVLQWPLPSEALSTPRTRLGAGCGSQLSSRLAGLQTLFHIWDSSALTLSLKLLSLYHSSTQPPTLCLWWAQDFTACWRSSCPEADSLLFPAEVSRIKKSLKQPRFPSETGGEEKWKTHTNQYLNPLFCYKQRLCNKGICRVQISHSRQELFR